jgi:hypothetical protein
LASCARPGAAISTMSKIRLHRGTPIVASTWSVVG